MSTPGAESDNLLPKRRKADINTKVYVALFAWDKVYVALFALLH